MVRLTQDLTSSKWIYTKSFLLLLISLISATLILIQVPRCNIFSLTADLSLGKLPVVLICILCDSKLSRSQLSLQWFI